MIPSGPTPGLLPPHQRVRHKSFHTCQQRERASLEPITPSPSLVRHSTLLVMKSRLLPFKRSQKNLLLCKLMLVSFLCSISCLLYSMHLLQTFLGLQPPLPPLKAISKHFFNPVSTWLLWDTLNKNTETYPWMSTTYHIITHVHKQS